mmetsp:Transcript_24037/g.23102  ORF Transcript_24037/g.23102 Transcript_24037/m.23102 type:complete len:174 (-) Transcript_24037:27-548(-)
MEAHTWTQDNSKQIRLLSQSQIYVAINSHILGDLNDDKAENFILKFQNFDFADYDEYTTVSSNVSIVRKNDGRTEGWGCTCFTNAKKFSCKHSVGVALIRGTLAAPVEAKTVLLGRRRKRGRPSRATGAWERQPFDILTPEAAHPPQNINILMGLEEVEEVAVALFPNVLTGS